MQSRDYFWTLETADGSGAEESVGCMACGEACFYFRDGTFTFLRRRGDQEGSCARFQVPSPIPASLSGQERCCEDDDAIFSCVCRIGSRLAAELPASIREEAYDNVCVCWGGGGMWYSNLFLIHLVSLSLLGTVLIGEIDSSGNKEVG